MEVLFSLPPRSLAYGLHRLYKDLSFSPIACRLLVQKVAFTALLSSLWTGIRNWATVASHGDGRDDALGLSPLTSLVFAGLGPTSLAPLSPTSWHLPGPRDLQSPRETTHVPRASWRSDLSGCLCGRALRKPGVSLLLSRGPFFSLPLSGFSVLEAAKCPRGFHDPKESRI